MTEVVGPLMKRWQEQRWVFDAVIRQIGIEFDQPRLRYMASPAGLLGQADFRMVGERVRKAADFDREFARAARRREARAEQHHADGRLESARDNFLVAALLWGSARWPIFEVNELLGHYEDRMTECYLRFAELAPHPITRVDIPFQGKELPAYLHLPHQPAPGETFPAVLAIPGMDSCKEVTVAMFGDQLLQRGIAVLAMDGPGQGEACYREIYVTNTNHMDSFRVAMDWLGAHPAIDAGRIAISGRSFGSFWATQGAAALGDRIRGVAVGACNHEPGAVTIFNAAAPSFKLRHMFMTGITDEAEFDEFAAGYDLRPIAGDITAPYLAIAGEDDQLSPIVHTYDLMERITSPKTLVVYEGANHSISEGASVQLGENRQVLMADWLRDRLEGAPLESEKWFIDAAGTTHRTPWS